MKTLNAKNAQICLLTLFVIVRRNRDSLYQIRTSFFIHVLWVPYMHPVPIFHNNLKIENFDLNLAYSFFGNVMNEWPFVTLEGYIPVKKISIRPPSRWNHSNIRFKILKFAFSLKVFSVFNMWSWNKTLREDNNVNICCPNI